MNTSEGAVQWYIEQLVTSRCARYTIGADTRTRYTPHRIPSERKITVYKDVKFVKSRALFSSAHASPCSEGTIGYLDHFKSGWKRSFDTVINTFNLLTGLAE
jgi:hypothetical protein